MKITITDVHNETVAITTDDDSVAREFESLPFEADHIAIVTVTRPAE
ncbi:hypothetical protein [Streptomyces niveus]